jgi:hypothetical protein
MLENLRHNQKKKKNSLLGDGKVTSSKIKRAIRLKTLVILRIKDEIRSKDRKRGRLDQEIERKRRNDLLTYVSFYYSLQLNAI